MKAFDFSLPDQNGDIHKLSDYRGQFVILYFYPKDDTPGCTVEACSFRDNQEIYKKNEVVVLGVSKDTVLSHKKFAQKHNLRFTIFSDVEKKVIKKYKAWGTKKFLGKTYEGILRKTYLIDKDGNIVKVYEKVNPLTHAEEILKDKENSKTLPE
ncbi:MAG: Peroxiredoxin bcp [Candidatus Roizmanbacteria bacterium GW2011_GWC2_34_23]|uniref:thioredoxin-dependent peroxiredoxin n=1 Tax=Candidatus Roizmanbacteria bacterium GW2011_GWC2_34_23 TaxID=1618484 RepID=A0A0G0B113_9BACT|nr:MAG: Peroxiredoxin bcp [Candidatus Roizmanbacteria bacterium GW2011_GWC2_34_23]